MLSRKVILTGSFGVGKTSLFRRFINNTFSEKYITTIGVKVDKKVVEVHGQEVSILLWDIAGEVKQDKVPKSYFLGASAIIYVFDLTRPSTYKNIEIDMDILKDILPDSIIKVVGNKADLIENEGVIEKILTDLKIPVDIVTSAKNGDNVENLFLGLAGDFFELIIPYECGRTRFTNLFFLHSLVLLWHFRSQKTDHKLKFIVRPFHCQKRDQKRPKET